MADHIVLGRPEPSDCNEYYFLYINRVPTGDVLGLLEEQLESTAGFLLGLEVSRLDYRYAPGKWSVKEVVGHVIDVERTFSYRAMCGARNEPADLPSLEQDPYVENSRYAVRPIEDVDLVIGVPQVECGPGIVIDAPRGSMEETPHLLAVHHRRVVGGGRPEEVTFFLWVRVAEGPRIGDEGAAEGEQLEAEAVVVSVAAATTGAHIGAVYDHVEVAVAHAEDTALGESL